MKRIILVTGGCGYIGSHTCVELLQHDFDVVVADNLVNSSAKSLERVESITGHNIPFFKIDITDDAAVDELFQEYSFDAVIHFAGLKSVFESSQIPLEYYRNNIGSTLTICRAMQHYGVCNIVFSSSATVYGDPSSVPITENFLTSATNPYGRSKLMIEEILRDLSAAAPSLNIALLRYFNPVGAHESGLIGEDPLGIPNNLMPFVSQVAAGKREMLNIFGGDYPTHDGTGVRDYIHVMDLALGHVKALNKLFENVGLKIYNLGTGCGYSVLEMVKIFEQVSECKIPYQIVERRKGDIAECFADPTKAEVELGWKAHRDIEAMVRDAWRWQSANPKGYGE